MQGTQGMSLFYQENQQNVDLLPYRKNFSVHYFPVAQPYDQDSLLQIGQPALGMHRPQHPVQTTSAVSLPTIDVPMDKFKVLSTSSDYCFNDVAYYSKLRRTFASILRNPTVGMRLFLNTVGQQEVREVLPILYQHFIRTKEIICTDDTPHLNNPGGIQAGVQRKTSFNQKLYELFQSYLEEDNGLRPFNIGRGQFRRGRFRRDGRWDGGGGGDDGGGGGPGGPYNQIPSQPPGNEPEMQYNDQEEDKQDLAFDARGAYDELEDIADNAVEQHDQRAARISPQYSPNDGDREVIGVHPGYPNNRGFGVSVPIPVTIKQEAQPMSEMEVEMEAKVDGQENLMETPPVITEQGEGLTVHADRQYNPEEYLKVEQMAINELNSIRRNFIHGEGKSAEANIIDLNHRIMALRDKVRSTDDPESQRFVHVLDTLLHVCASVRLGDEDSVTAGMTRLQKEAHTASAAIQPLVADIAVSLQEDIYDLRAARRGEEYAVNRLGVEAFLAVEIRKKDIDMIQRQSAGFSTLISEINNPVVTSTFEASHEEVIYDIVQARSRIEELRVQTLEQFKNNTAEFHADVNVFFESKGGTDNVQVPLIELDDTSDKPMGERNPGPQKNKLERATQRRVKRKKEHLAAMYGNEEVKDLSVFEKHSPVIGPPSSSNPSLDESQQRIQEIDTARSNLLKIMEKLRDTSPVGLGFEHQDSVAYLLRHPDAWEDMLKIYRDAVDRWNQGGEQVEDYGFILAFITALNQAFGQTDAINAILAGIPQGRGFSDWFGGQSKDQRYSILQRIGGAYETIMRQGLFNIADEAYIGEDVSYRSIDNALKRVENIRMVSEMKVEQTEFVDYFRNIESYQELIDQLNLDLIRFINASGFGDRDTQLVARLARDTGVFAKLAKTSDHTIRIAINIWAEEQARKLWSTVGAHPKVDVGDNKDLIQAMDSSARVPNSNRLVLMQSNPMDAALTGDQLSYTTLKEHAESYIRRGGTIEGFRSIYAKAHEVSPYQIHEGHYVNLAWRLAQLAWYRMHLHSSDYVGLRQRFPKETYDAERLQKYGDAIYNEGRGYEAHNNLAISTVKYYKAAVENHNRR